MLNLLWKYPSSFLLPRPLLPVLKPQRRAFSLPSLWPHLIHGHPSCQVFVSVGLLYMFWRFPQCYLGPVMISTPNVEQAILVAFPLGGFRSRYNPEYGVLFIFPCGYHKIKDHCYLPDIHWKLQYWIVTVYVPEYLRHVGDFWKQTLRRKLLMEKSRWGEYFRGVFLVFHSNHASGYHLIIR